MREDCDIEDVRAQFDAFLAKPLVQEKTYRNQFCGVGGTWSSKDGEITFTLGRANEYAFQTGSLARDGLIILHGTLSLGRNCRIKVCVTRWVEKLGTSNLKRLLLGPRQPTGLISHVIVERMNFAHFNKVTVDCLTLDDLERVEALIKPAMQEFLQRSVAQEQNTQSRYGRHAVPVAGKLHWRWRDPSPELMKFHALCADFSRNATLEHHKRIVPGDYEREAGGYVFRPHEDPTAKITVPSVNRDNPEFYALGADIKGHKFSIDVHDLGLTYRSHNPDLACVDDRVVGIQLHLMISPKSKLLLSGGRHVGMPDSLTRKAEAYAYSAFLEPKRRTFKRGRNLQGAKEEQVKMYDVIFL